MDEVVQRILITNRLVEYADRLADAGVTDLSSLESYCRGSSAEDLVVGGSLLCQRKYNDHTHTSGQEKIGMKPLQARALIDLVTNVSHPRSPRMSRDNVAGGGGRKFFADRPEVVIVMLGVALLRISITNFS